LARDHERALNRIIRRILKLLSQSLHPEAKVARRPEAKVAIAKERTPNLD
jgi:hypothetical protein